MPDLLIPCKLGKYFLTSLTHLRQDNLQHFLGGSPGVYIAPAPTAEWHTKFKIPLKWNYCIPKKSKMFSNMGQGSIWVSRTPQVSIRQKTKRWFDGRILHIEYSSGFVRIPQLLQTIKIIIYLYTKRSMFTYCFIYNFDLPFYGIGLFFKLLFGKKIVVDFEDDYTCVRTSIIKNTINHFLFKTADKVICINESMVRHFPNKATCVFNAFADLKYINAPIRTIHPGASFLLSSTLDEIRGADLIPEIIALLQQTLGTFMLHITGDGPLSETVRLHTSDKVIYHGFLDDLRYTNLLQSIDICLVLQKPDHPFSKGSFPSKIDFYAQYKKPILVLSNDIS